MVAVEKVLLKQMSKAIPVMYLKPFQGVVSEMNVKEHKLF